MSAHHSSSPSPSTITHPPRPTPRAHVRLIAQRRGDAQCAERDRRQLRPAFANHTGHHELPGVVHVQATTPRVWTRDAWACRAARASHKLHRPQRPRVVRQSRPALPWQRVCHRQVPAHVHRQLSSTEINMTEHQLMPRARALVVCQRTAGSCVELRRACLWLVPVAALFQVRFVVPLRIVLSGDSRRVTRAFQFLREQGKAT